MLVACAALLPRAAPATTAPAKPRSQYNNQLLQLCFLGLLQPPASQIVLSTILSLWAFRAINMIHAQKVIDTFYI